MTGLPVGTVVYSMLEEPAFQQHVGPDEKWVLADGRSVAGQNTDYELLTNTTTIPNLLGVFVRGKNHGRQDAFRNPDGDLALGQVTSHRLQRHNHGGQTGQDSPDHVHGFGGYPFRVSYGNNNNTANLEVAPNGFHRATEGASTRHAHPIVPDGNSDETAPTNVTLNPFIRID
jgi:hypothetical protein